MSWIFTILFAAVLTVFQIGFLSWLPSPWNLLSLPIVAITLAVAADRRLEGAVWALVAGVLLDLHGLYGFGTRTAILFIVYLAQRALFARVLTNASKSALFLLAAAGVAAQFLCLIALDGARVLFGAAPYALADGSSTAFMILSAAVWNGLLTVAVFSLSALFRRRFEAVFIPKRAA